MRSLKYREALSEGLVQAMEADPSIFVMGVGVDDPKGILEPHQGPSKPLGIPGYSILRSQKIP